MSPTFAVAMQLATEDVTPFLDNPDALEAWVDRAIKKDLEDYSIGALRAKASKLRIQFYTSYTKPNLILKIIEVQNARKASTLLDTVPPSCSGRDSEIASSIGRILSDSTGDGGTGGIENGTDCIRQGLEAETRNSTHQPSPLQSIG